MEYFNKFNVWYKEKPETTEKGFYLFQISEMELDGKPEPLFFPLPRKTTNKFLHSSIYDIVSSIRQYAKDESQRTIESIDFYELRD